MTWDVEEAEGMSAAMYNRREREAEAEYQERALGPCPDCGACEYVMTDPGTAGDRYGTRTGYVTPPEPPVYECAGCGNER